MEMVKPTWWPELEVSEPICKNFKQLYSGCGCIHEGFRSLTVHSKECVYARDDKMTEEQYQDQRSRQPCNKDDTIHVLFDGACQLCRTGPQIFSRSRNSLRRVKSKIEGVLKVEDRSPPRQKLPITAEKPNALSEAEIDRRVALWRAQTDRYEEVLVRRIEERRQARKNAYTAFIVSDRAREVIAEVPEDKRFFLFNFKGGPGGDLLSPADEFLVVGARLSTYKFQELDTSRPAGHICRYCDTETREGNGPPEKLPCGCHVHRDCATDQFFLAEYSLIRRRGRCFCGCVFELRHLHTNFEDDAYP